MIQLRRKILLLLLKASDVVLFFLSAYIAYFFLEKEWVPIGTIFFKSIKVGTVIFFSVLFLFGDWLRDYFKLYASRRLSRFLREVLDIFKMSTLLVVFGGFFGIFFDTPSSSPLFLGYFWLIINALTISFRFILRIFLSQVRMHGRNLRKAVVVGSNKIAVEWADWINKQKEFGIHVLGFVDDRLISDLSNEKYLGKVDELPGILQENVIDEVVIAMPIKSNYEIIQKTIGYAEEQGVLIRYAYPLFGARPGFVNAEPNIFAYNSRLGNLLYPSPLQSYQYAFKRFMDIVLSGLFLIICSPLMLVVAALIKLTSKGPVFFVQDRIGLNKRMFKCLKFRTMSADAEIQQLILEAQNEMDGAAFKIQNDPRVTKIGRFLRNTSIDELPQLFNVVMGDISLVGPRPLPVRDYKRFDSYWYSRRQSVLPGMTCTWQISGRSNLTFEEWMKLDLEYIDNWSLVNDLVILLKTLPAVIKRTGAY